MEHLYSYFYNSHGGKARGLLQSGFQTLYYCGIKTAVV